MRWFMPPAIGTLQSNAIPRIEVISLVGCSDSWRRRTQGMLHEGRNGIFEVAAIKSTFVSVSDTDIRYHSFQILLQSLVFVTHTKPDGKHKHIYRCVE